MSEPRYDVMMRSEDGERLLRSAFGSAREVWRPFSWAQARAAFSEAVEADALVSRDQRDGITYVVVEVQS